METDIEIEKLSVIKKERKAFEMVPNDWRRLFLAALVMTVISILHVFLGMQVRGVYGFSFDDSWIHVQYARSIFVGAPWEYSTDIPSTGSSAPLWSVVLVPIFLLGFARDTIVTAVLIISSIFIPCGRNCKATN
jgi:hypothetical protein